MPIRKITILEPTTLEACCTRVGEIADLAGSYPFGCYLQTSPPQRLECRLPLQLDRNQSEVRFFFGKPANEFDLDFKFAPTYLASLPYGRLVGKAYVVVSNDNRVIEDSYSADHVLQSTGHFLQKTLTVELDGELHRIPLVLFRSEAAPRRIAQPAVLPVHYWHFNYHHWLVECLPRLHCVLERPELAECAIIAPRDIREFQRESLELLGLGPERLLSFDGTDWRIETLYFPSVGNFSPTELKWLRQRCLLGASISGHEPADGRYYVSRSDAPQRRVANEAEIVAYLKGQGFENVCLEGIPFQRQVELFAKARVIVGPHGSGLTNMLFAPTDLTLVELMPNDEVNHCFWLMANVLGQSYTYVVGQKVSDNRDFVVPLRRLQNALAAIL